MPVENTIEIEEEFDKFIEWLVKQGRSSARQLQMFAVVMSLK